MSNHDASAQASGYLYQVQCALLFLLRSEDEDVKICIEKFDDVTFHKNSDIIHQLQLKYHSSDGNITNSSIDFWRTLNVWIDAINKNPVLLETTKFYIITTNRIAAGSVIEKIKKNNKDETIYNELKNIAINGTQSCSQNSQSYKFYSAFIQFKEEKAKNLIKSMVIIPEFYKPSEINAKILSAIKIFTTKTTERIVVERLMGWWYEKMVACLENPNPTFISFDELRRRISNILSDLKNDTLPIDVTEIEIRAIESESNVENIVKQLQLINAQERKINIALQNYYKSYAQRSKWIKESLIYADELDRYDQKLTDEWGFQFSETTDNINDATSENDKIEAGKQLYKTLMNKDLPIRPNLNDNTISRGSYNSLANELTIGWHPDFKEKMK